MPTRQLFHEGEPVCLNDHTQDFVWYYYRDDSMRHFLKMTEEFSTNMWRSRYNLVFACGMKRSDRWARRANHASRMCIDQHKYCPECLRQYHKLRFNKEVSDRPTIDQILQIVEES